MSDRPAAVQQSRTRARRAGTRGMPRADRERLIHRVTGTVFARDGYHSASMDEIAAIAQETEIEDPAPTPHAMADSPEDGTADGLDGRRLQLVPPPAPSTAIKHAPPPAAERDESPEEVAERERLYRELMGIPDPKPRRLWRR